MLNLAMLISGGGSTAASIIRACFDGGVLDGLVNPCLVISSVPNAKGIERVIEAGMDPASIVVVCKKSFRGAEEFGEEILRELDTHKADFFGQYGWIPFTPVKVVKEYEKRCVNQHPGAIRPGDIALGGKGMYGLRVHAAAVAFHRLTGRHPHAEATVQWVGTEFDEGAVLGRKLVPIEPGDSPIDLQQRVLPSEHELQIEFLQSYAQGPVEELVLPKFILDSEVGWLHEARKFAQLMFP